MDSSTLTALLEANNQAFRTALDIITEQYNLRISCLETKVSELTRSLEYSQAEVSDLKKDVGTLRKNDGENRTTIQALNVRVDELTQRTNYQEDYSRRKNIRINGVREPENGETWEQTTEQVKKVIQDKLQLPQIELQRAHRVGTFGGHQPRTIIARFEKFADREAVIRNSRKLKGTGIYLNDDLCPASQEIVRNQIPAMKKARAEGKVAYFKHTRLVIRDRSRHPTMAGPSTGGTDGFLVSVADVASGTRAGTSGIAASVAVAPVGATVGADGGDCDGPDGDAFITSIAPASGDNVLGGEVVSAGVSVAGISTYSSVASSPPRQVKPKKDLRKRKDK